MTHERAKQLREIGALYKLIPCPICNKETRSMPSHMWKKHGKNLPKKAN